MDTRIDRETLTIVNLAIKLIELFFGASKGANLDGQNHITECKISKDELGLRVKHDPKAKVARIGISGRFSQRPRMDLPYVYQGFEIVLILISDGTGKRSIIASAIVICDAEGVGPCVSFNDELMRELDITKPAVFQTLTNGDFGFDRTKWARSSFESTKNSSVELSRFIQAAL